MKRQKSQMGEVMDELRKQLFATEKFKAHLRENEPDWPSLVAEFGFEQDHADQLIARLRQLWLLPFADIRAIADLLFFQYGRLPDLRVEFKKQKNERSLRLCALFDLFTDMAMQGNSIFPQNPTHLARQVQLALETSFMGKDYLDPLLDLLLDARTGQAAAGFNAEKVADLFSIIESEHQRRESVVEGNWKARHKFDDYKQQILDNPEFHADWAVIKRYFDLEKAQDSRGIIRRTRLPEGNWQIPSFPNLQYTRDRFQVAFDFFCWKWFLWGMQNDEPLVEKLSCTITPYGTQIFIPGYWSFDAARDLDWKKLLRLHRARGIAKQGIKLGENRKQRNAQLAKLKQAIERAKQLKLHGDQRYEFLKKEAGLSPFTDDAQVRRMLKKTK
jgi:hypothetical protein